MENTENGMRLLSFSEENDIYGVIFPENLTKVDTHGAIKEQTKLLYSISTLINRKVSNTLSVYEY